MKKASKSTGCRSAPVCLCYMVRLLQLRHNLIMIERLVLRLFHHRAVRLASGPDFKETVHLVERHGLRLRDEEPHESEAAESHGAEEEIHAVARLAHAVDHVGRDAGDDECPEPVGHRSEELPDVAGALAEHFGVDDPWSAVPGVDVDGRPEVNHEDRGDARR